MDVIKSFQSLPTDTFMRAVNAGFSCHEWDHPSINWPNTGYFVWKVWALSQEVFKAFPQYKTVTTFAAWGAALSGSACLITLIEKIPKYKIGVYTQKIQNGTTLNEEDKKIQAYVFAVQWQSSLVNILKAIDIGLPVLDLFYWQRNQAVAGLKLTTVFAKYAADYVRGLRDFPMRELLGSRIPAAVNNAVKAYIVYQDYLSGNFVQALNAGDYKRVASACAHAYSCLYLT